jgi:hypothetical protein
MPRPQIAPPTPHPLVKAPPAVTPPHALAPQPAPAAQPAVALPWEAMVPYPLEKVPMPLGPAPKAADALAINDAFSHYADTPQPLGPVPTPKVVSRPDRIAGKETELAAANYVVQHLPESQKASYLEDQLGSLQKFASEVVPAGSNQQTVPDALIKNARPLIEDLERLPAPAGTTTAGKNPEAAHAGTGTDWNTTLGVPEYRSQSTNLIPPEASCNMTSLAMSLERMGYGRENSMAAIDHELKAKYLEEERKKLAAQHKDPSALPQVGDVQLPAGYFEQNVKTYLKSVDDAAGKPYQGIRGKMTDDTARDAIAAQYHDKAQFQDTLDYLRYLTKAGDRTDLDSVAPKLLEKLEPDKDKRPTYRTITPGAHLDWTGARGQLSDVLGEGGAAMLSYEHKGGNNTAASHIISVQSMTQDGILADDPYGRARTDYRLNQTGDAYGPKGGGPRTADRKNMPDLGGVASSDASHVDSNWTAERGQNLHASESHGESSAYTNDMFSGSWRSLRFLEPAAPKPVVPAPAVTPAKTT